MNNKRIIILANGEIKNYKYLSQYISKDDYIICANGGTKHALRMNITPDIIIGDLDSLSNSIYNKLDRTIKVIKYPAEKDASDLELAIKKALELHPKEIVILGALGKRIDHVFANTMLLALPLEHGIKTKILDDCHEIYIINSHLEVFGEIGDYISLFALTADVKGITTLGLKYPLRGETLYFNNTRGLSNELLTKNAEITIEQGYLLVIKKNSIWI